MCERIKITGVFTLEYKPSKKCYESGLDINGMMEDDLKYAAEEPANFVWDFASLIKFSKLRGEVL